MPARIERCSAGGEGDPAARSALVLNAAAAHLCGGAGVRRFARRVGQRARRCAWNGAEALAEFVGWRDAVAAA